MVVKGEVAPQSLLQRATVFVVPEVDVLLLDTAPEPFDEHVVEGPASAIHRDANAGSFHAGGKPTGGELHPLIGIEDLRSAPLQGRLQRLQAKPAIERVRELPREHIPAVPVDDGHQIHEPVRHRHIRDIGAPHLAGTLHFHVPKQVGIDFVLGPSLARLGLGINRLDAHVAHQTLNALAIDHVAEPTQVLLHPAAAIEGPLEILFVDQTHEQQVLGGL